MAQAPTHPAPAPTPYPSRARARGVPLTAAIAGQDPDDLLTWLVIGLGLTSLYFPTLWDLMHEHWGSGLHGHSLFVLVATLGLLRRAWPRLRTLPADRRHAPLAYATIFVSSCFYALGRSQDIPTFEAGSGAFMVAGCTLLLRGAAGVRLHWFTLVFMLMAVPLPVDLTDLLTPVMQDVVCATTVQLLQWAQLTARCNTVSLWVLSHELPLSYAVPGLTTLASLLAGLALYLHLVPAPGRRARWALVLLAPVIVLLACTARPVVLAWLSTYAVPLSAPLSYVLATVMPYVCAAALVLLIDLPPRLWRSAGRPAVPAPTTTSTTASPGPDA